jgi:hypothetical protein
METKTCSRCGEEKPLVDFHLRSKKEPWPKSACKDCHRERARGYWVKNPLPKEAQREKNLQSAFGIGIKDYEALLEKQGNRCAICEIDTCASGRNFAVDHDHKTGKIRGLLCKFCNTALGQFKENQTSLLKAVEYLKGNTNGY